MRALSPVSTCCPATLRISCENTAGSSAPPVLISLAGGKEIFWATSWSWTIPLMNPLPQKAKPAQKPSTSMRITWRLTTLQRSPLFTSYPPCRLWSRPLACSLGISQPAPLHGDDRRLAPGGSDAVLLGSGPSALHRAPGPRDARNVMRIVVVALKARGEAACLAAAAAALADREGWVEVFHVRADHTPSELAAADQAVAQAVDLLRSRGITARGHVEVAAEGGVSGQLVERARAFGADVVVVGSRGLGLVGGLVAGSVSHSVLADLDVPVLVLPRGAQVPDRGPRRILV